MGILFLSYCCLCPWLNSLTLAGCNIKVIRSIGNNKLHKVPPERRHIMDPQTFQNKCCINPLNKVWQNGLSSIKIHMKCGWPKRSIEMLALTRCFFLVGVWLWHWEKKAHETNIKQKHHVITVRRKNTITKAHWAKGLHFCRRTNLVWSRKKSKVGDAGQHLC